MMKYDGDDGEKNDGTLCRFPLERKKFLVCANLRLVNFSAVDICIFIWFTRLRFIFILFYLFCPVVVKWEVVI